MRRFFLLGLVLLMSLSSFSAWSQLQLPGDMTAEQATTIIKAAQEKAEAENILVNVAIVDAGANLKAFLRMDHI